MFPEYARPVNVSRITCSERLEMFPEYARPVYMQLGQVKKFPEFPVARDWKCFQNMRGQCTLAAHILETFPIPRYRKFWKFFHLAKLHVHWPRIFWKHFQSRATGKHFQIALISKRKKTQQF